MNTMNIDTPRTDKIWARVDPQVSEWGDVKILYEELKKLERELDAAQKQLAECVSVPVDIGALVDRFLQWKLPTTVCSDGCVVMPDYQHPRFGTSLLTESEAKQMLEYVLSAAPNPAPVHGGQTDVANDALKGSR